MLIEYMDFDLMLFEYLDFDFEELGIYLLQRMSFHYYKNYGFEIVEIYQ